jgi:D-glycero-alpha-D-manno-heptose 1-phosphate guanylyltransferase
MITAIILAGGKGTRLRKAIPDLPKPLAPIGNRTFLELLLDYWINQGINNFILSVGYKSDLIINYLGNKYKNASIEYSIEKETLGTGGGLYLAAKNLVNPFLVINGDTFTEVNLKELFEYHVDKNSEWSISLYRIKKNDRYNGIYLTSKGVISNFNYDKSITNQLINAGVYIMNPSIINLISSLQLHSFSIEKDLVKIFNVGNKNIYGLEYKGKFIDIGIPEDYNKAKKLLRF